MNHLIYIQHASEANIPVNDSTLKKWIKAGLSNCSHPIEVTLRLVDAGEIQQLNATYRQQDKPTNVLAFPSSLPKNFFKNRWIIGDIIICPTVIVQEAATLHTTVVAHFAHIVIHGVLHLQGYDHIATEDATIMQGLEKKILATLGFADPYQVEDEYIEQKQS